MLLLLLHHQTSKPKKSKERRKKAGNIEFIKYESVCMDVLAADGKMRQKVIAFVVGGGNGVEDTFFMLFIILGLALVELFI